MPDWLLIVALVLLGLIVGLAVGGAIAQRRRLAATRGRFDESLERVNADLAAAHAADRGWEPSGLEAAARRAWAEHGGGAEPERLVLVQVVDPPGTDADKAVFAVDAAGATTRITLGRRGDDWVFETLA